MKLTLNTLLLLIGICSPILAQTTSPTAGKLNPTKPVQTAEISCGQCKFKLKGKGCDLAVRIRGKAYFVDGAHIDSFGDAHAKMGFCNAISKADVQGEVVKGRFKATYVKLIEPVKGRSL